MAEDDDIKPEVVDVEQMKRENYFNLGRDDYMSLDEYLLSPQSDRDLKSKRGKATLPKYDRPNKDDRMSDRDKEVLKKVREKNPRVSDQDLALGLRMMKADPRKSDKDNAFDKQVKQIKQFIMDLDTFVPRTKDVFKTNVRAKEGGKVRGRKRGGTKLGDLNKDGKMSGYEKVRQKAIEKSMAAQRKK